MKKTNKLISILLAVVMLLSMAPLSFTAFASANDKLFIQGNVILLKGNAATIEAGSKSGYTKIKVGGEYVDFSQCNYPGGDPMFTLGNDKYEADLSDTNIVGAQYGSMTGDVNITMTGGVVKKIIGSCIDPGTVLTGNVNITMTGGKVTEIWCAEYDVNGNVNITITGGTVDKFVYLIYRSYVTISGDCWVTITGGSPGTLNRHGGSGDKIQGSTHLYSTTLPYGYDRDNFTNFVYRDGSNWKFRGDTATALNGNTLTIASGQTATVDSGQTLSGKIVNNGTINVKNGGTLSGTITNKGTIWGYGNISGVTNSGSGKAIKKVTASGQNVTFNDSAWQNNKTNYDDDYNATLTPASGYALPASVTVKVGGTTLAESAYTYNASTGALSIPAAKITTDTTVSATGRLDLSDSANVVTIEPSKFTYNGEQINIRPIVNGNILKENDYTVEYSDPVNAGIGTATITGKNSCTGSVTVEYEIYRASILGADITLAGTLIYNGSDQTMKVDSVVFSGKTFKEGVDYEVRDNVGRDAGVYTLKVVGINNVESSIPVEWEIKTCPVTVTADERAKIYGTNDPANLTYSIDLPTSSYSLDGSLERDQGENVGVYAINQGTVTNENNPNYDITFEGAVFTIEPDLSDIDGLTVNNVKSTDKAAIEAVINQIDNAKTNLASEKKIAEWNAIKSNCVEMLNRIEFVENQLQTFDDKLHGYDIDTVTSDDADELETLQNSVAKFYNDYFTNLINDQITGIAYLIEDIEILETRISDVAEEITRITNAVNGYNEESVKSSDEADIFHLKADIKALTDGQNITADERAKLENLDETCDMLLEKIAETTAEYDRVVALANSYDKKTVTSADMDALAQLDTDIFALALTDNVTSEEKNTLMYAHSNVFDCIQRVTYVSNEIKRIVEAVEKYVFESVKSDDKADIEKLIEDIKALTDTQNITADERTLLKGADETCDKLIAKIDETVAEANRINETANAYDINTVTSDDKADIEKLISDIKALTDGDNINDTERNQLNGNDATLDALLERINATAEEIARIEEAVNGYNEATVKSTDKADLEQLVEDIKALTDATNITEEERADLGDTDATVDSLIKKIDDTAAEIARIDKAVSDYNEETVKSSDIPALGKLINDIKALTDGDNLTEDERAALESNDEAIDNLVEKLAEVAKEIKRVDEAAKSYDENTVKSSDSEALAQLKKDVQALIDSDNTTENEKTVLGEMIEKIDALEDKIAETEAKLEEIAGIENSYKPETVTSDDKADIKRTIAEIEKVNPDNLTDEQKAEYEEIKASLEELLKKIAAAEKQVKDMSTKLAVFDEKTVTIFKEEEIKNILDEVNALIGDTNMGEKELEKLSSLKKQSENLIEVINNPCKYFSLRLFYLIRDCLNWKWDGIKHIFSFIFG